jgi:virulence-associated protein VapD
VTYQYYGTDWNAAIDAVGFHRGTGSYSDIKELDALGCKFMNIGCGYVGEHSEFCYANLIKTTEQIAKFKSFYDNLNDLRFPHARSDNYKGSYWQDRNGYASDYKYDKEYYSRYRGDSDIKRCLNCNRVLFVSEVADGVCGVCIQNEGAYVTSFEQDGMWYSKSTDGLIVDSNGQEVCSLCLAVLQPHEKEMCDDCWEFEQREKAHTKEVEDIDDD